MDPRERRWVIGGGVVAIIGIVGCVIAAALNRAPTNPLQSNGFIVFLAVAVLGLGLIVAAGARDALLNDGGTRRLGLERLDAMANAPVEDVTEHLTIRPVYSNLSEGSAYRTRFEVALQADVEVKSLILEALAPSVREVRFDDVRIVQRDVGHHLGIAWASMPDPPPLFRVDVVTSLPEEHISLRCSAS